MQGLSAEEAVVARHASPQMGILTMLLVVDDHGGAAAVRRVEHLLVLVGVQCDRQDGCGGL